MKTNLRFWLVLCSAAVCPAQPVVSVEVDAARTLGPLPPIYAFFGNDEPNYAYTSNGRKLIGELSRLSAAPVYLRTHFLLATGDGKAELKWGSTNAYREDATGHPVYDWTIGDRIFDTYLAAGVKPFVEIGFMPEALSSKPEPYHVPWIPGAPNRDYFAGWSYPPRDYAKWGELVYQWVKHCAVKYGAREVESWYWEVWNEPDIAYWHGTPEEYDKLYDYAAAALKRALPGGRVGGPASTGPANPRAAAFLKQFLEHCERAGSPLDFISYHAKGRPAVEDGHVRMGIASNARDVDRGLEIVLSFRKFAALPIVLSECDPEGCAACSARLYPQNAYRNGPLYAAYTAAMWKANLELAARRQANLAGMLTWAFEFEDQPYFAGLRTLATNGIDKAVMNLFRMLGLMQGRRIAAESTGRTPLDALLAGGVRGAPDIDALSTRTERQISVLIWNYHDDDLPAEAAPVQLHVSGIPGFVSRAIIRHYRIDETHSNAWSLWKEMGSPAAPSSTQYRSLEQAGQLQELESPRWQAVHGSAAIEFALPRQAVSLIELAW